MAVVVIDTIKPKNNGTFPVVEAVDVKVTDSKRLDAALNDKANQSDLNALSNTVSGKASQSDLNALSTTVAGKQNALSEEQLTACNSGITSELVTQIGTNTTAIAGKASQADLNTTNAAVAAKADASDVETATANLQSQIDELVTPVTQDAEVQNARVGADGTTYTSLKSRIDTEVTSLQKEVNPLKKSLDVENIEFGYTGKQIFNKTKATDHGYYNAEGTYVSNSGLSGYMIYCKDYVSLLFVDSTNYWISFHEKDGTFISASTPVTRNTAISIPNDAVYVCVNVPTGDLNIALVYKYGLIEKPDYKEYLDVTIEKYEKNVNSITCGKNLFNKAKVTADHVWWYTTGKYQANGEGYSASDYIPVKASTTYGLNVVAHMCYWDSNKKFISGEINNDGFHTHTTPANTAYLTISVQNLNGCMLTEGSTEYLYEAYKEQLTYGVYDFKEPYQSGYIYHTFRVPQTKAFTYEYYENTAYLKLPSTYSPTGPATKLCILCHGASMGISDDGSTGWTYNTGYNKIVSALNSYGYAVIDSNGYNDSVNSGHEHWGAPQALAGYLKAYEYFTERYNLEKTVYMYGFSMGGLTALNLAINRSFPIKCMMIAAPVISLYDQCVSGTAQSVNSDFLLAYGMTQYNADACRGYDRYKDIVELNDSTYIFKSIPPIYGAYGESDTAISNQKIQDYFSALHHSNYDARLVGYQGGHEISFGGNQNVINDMIIFFNYY